MVLADADAFAAVNAKLRCNNSFAVSNPDGLCRAAFDAVDAAFA